MTPVTDGYGAALSALPFGEKHPLLSLCTAAARACRLSRSPTSPHLVRKAEATARAHMVRANNQTSTCSCRLHSCWNLIICPECHECVSDTVGEVPHVLWCACFDNSACFTAPSSRGFPTRVAFDPRGRAEACERFFGGQTRTVEPAAREEERQIGSFIRRGQRCSCSWVGSR